MELNPHISDKPLTINTPVTLWHIANEVAYKHGLTIGAMRSKRRTGPISACRFEYFYRAATETNKTWGQISRVVLVDYTSAGYGAMRYALNNNLPAPRGIDWCRGKIAARAAYPKTLKTTEDKRTVIAVDEILNDK